MDAANANTRADIVRGEVDWAEVLALAELHGLVPLLHRHLSHDTAASPAIREPLSRAAHAIAQRNLLLTARLLEVLSVLGRNNVVAVPFKGPALAARAYGSIAYRQFDDLDLFIRPSDLGTAREALTTELGYTSEFPSSPRRQSLFFRSENQLLMRGPGDVIVELHWAVERATLAIDVDVEPIMRRAGCVSIGGRNVAHPGPEDTLVLLCIHGTKHEWRRIGWIMDVAELIRANPVLAWDDAIAFAADAGVARMVRLGLLLAVDVLDAEIPPMIDEWARADRRAEALSTQVRERLHVDRGGYPDTVSRTRFHVAARERWRDQLRRAWRQLVTSTDAEWDLVSLPAQLSFVYSMLRPLRIVLKRTTPGFPVRRAASRRA